MDKNEKKLLQSIKNHGRGLLSGADLFNGIGENKSDKAIHRLIAEGYVEETEHELFGRKHTAYRISGKGHLFFDPFYKKWWHMIIGDIRTIIVSVIISLLTTIVTLWVTKIFNS